MKFVNLTMTLDLVTQSSKWTLSEINTNQIIKIFDSPSLARLWAEQNGYMIVSRDRKPTPEPALRDPKPSFIPKTSKTRILVVRDPSKLS
jgi:hypothetical protein